MKKKNLIEVIKGNSFSIYTSEKSYKPGTWIIDPLTNEPYYCIEEDQLVSLSQILVKLFDIVNDR